MELVHDKKPYFLIDSNYRCPRLPNLYLAGFSEGPETTLRVYGYALCHWLTHCENRGLNWQEVREIDVVQYRKTLKGDTGSKNYRISRLVAFYNWCERKGVRSPFERVVKRRAPLFFPSEYKEIRLQPLPDVMRFLKALSERDRMIAHVMLYCGLRRSEVLSLPRSIVTEPDEGNVSFFPVKGKGSKERTARMPKVLKDELTAWLAGQPASRWLFHRNGEPLCPDTIGAAFLKARKATGIPIHAHLLRHTFASIRFEEEKAHEGVDGALKIVQIELGHSKVATTERYLHAMRKEGVCSSYGSFVQQITEKVIGGGK